MGLVNLEILPGLYTETSGRGALNRYKNGLNVRFDNNGWPEKVGGYTKQIDSQFIGICRAMFSWTSLDYARYIALGTSKKLYLTNGDTFFDITPIRASGTLTDPFTTTNGSNIVVVDDTAHGLSVGDYIEFPSVASTVGGLNMTGEWIVSTVVDDDSYQFEHTSNATSDAGPGGGSTDYEYQIGIGYDDTFIGLGFGAGPFGAGTFGTPRTIGSVTEARTWSLSGWGEDLIGNPRGGSIYVWVQDNGTSTRAVIISQAPACLKAVVSPEDRQIIAFGAYSAALSAIDPLLIKWCDKEDYTIWTAASGNNAGQKRLDRGNEIQTAVGSRGGFVILTDRTVYTMFRVADEFVFDFQAEGESLGAIGPNCAVDVNGTVYWMANGQFMMFDGEARPIPCDILSTVFDDFNWLQEAKVYCSRVRRKNEVLWHYCSADSSEVDRVVGYNTETKTWWIGDEYIARTAWLDRNTITTEPQACGTNSYLYVQETGVDADGAALPYSLETYDIEIPATEVSGPGEFIYSIGPLVADFKSISGTHKLTLTGRKWPSDDEDLRTKGPFSFTSKTNKIDAHLRARQISLKWSSDQIGADFVMGRWRANVVPLGRR